MKTRNKILITALVIAIPAFALSPGAPLGQMIWPEVQGSEMTGGQIGLLMVYTVGSSLAMGVALGYLAFGFEWTRRVFTRWTAAAHLALVFVPATYWIHDSLHMVNGENVAGLIALEYGFHLPAFVAGICLMTATAKSVAAKAKTTVSPVASPAR